MKKKFEKDIETKLSELRGDIQNKIIELGLFGKMPAYPMAVAAVRAICDAVEFYSNVEDMKKPEEPAVPEPVAIMAKALSEITGKPVHVRIMKKGEWEQPNEKKGKNRKFREKMNKKSSKKSNKKVPF